MKKVLSCVFALMFVFSAVACIPASAADANSGVCAISSADDGGVMPMSSYVDNRIVRLRISGLSATVSGELSTVPPVIKITIKLELQKLSSGEYKTVKTWEETFNSTYAYLEDSAIVNPFSTYRLKGTFTAATATGAELAVCYAYE